MGEPPRANRDLGAGRGQQRGKQTGTGMAADAGTWRVMQGKAAEAGGRRVWEESRWAALCTGRGGEERVKIERSSKRNGYGWRGGRKEGGKKDP